MPVITQYQTRRIDRQSECRYLIPYLLAMVAVVAVACFWMEWKLAGVILLVLAASASVIYTDPCHSVPEPNDLLPPEEP